MFTRDSSLHHVQLLTAHVRCNGERQTSIQMVAPRSKSYGFTQEAALALRTYAFAVQFSYERKAKSMTVRDLVNNAVAEHRGGDFHRKTLVSVLENESSSYQGAP
jgi:hypothetical protein